ncbi:hypothetical protein GCM10011391_35150 [Pullulanibacillus camelliae]|uniref:SAF domain-containing protein n=1 Tax=Pullulanibacillus camelliae TaxID=1707096 RepID=A0A8J2YM74_9BACL|nr:UxaA family hydrolase [Pullulanibacillus camelliae]GGE53226.1 hypothetical protein GCM10011391_35150 [Pullulanibacillus camelliae]
MHKFLIHYKGDHVGVAVQDIAANEKVQGVFMDDNTTIDVRAKAAIPLGHKIAIANVEEEAKVIEYKVPIGFAPNGLKVGDYVHTHNLKTLRW